ncbi:hypothetical protein [Haloferula sargassicola]|uniref:hypothetical protein n=1 Tax=Haloferula sargassicola TaxID=490096 RepID=UPI003365A2E4
MQLSQEQVARLSEKELEAYSRVVIDGSRYRRAKLKRARGYWSREIIPILAPLLAVAFVWGDAGVDWRLLGLFAAAVGLVQIHVVGLNRRIDALMNLLDLEVGASDDVVVSRTQPTTENAEQSVTPQSATRSELSSEGGLKPQPESEARSR